MDQRENKRLWTMQRGTMVMFVAEIIGTGVLMFIGCMGCIGTMVLEPPPPLQMALTFGLTVNLIIMMLGHISGAHLNPAVTIGAVIVGLKSIPTGTIYILGQFIGATIGYGILKMITPAELFHDGNVNSTAPLCVTVIYPGITIVQAILIETFCTAIILCAACATWDPRCAHNTDSTALRFGFSVAAISFAAVISTGRMKNQVEHSVQALLPLTSCRWKTFKPILFQSPYTGCSMNPARSFAPALWNWAWKHQWVYWLGPSIGALLGTYTYELLFKEDSIVHSRSHAEITDVNAFNTHLNYKVTVGEQIVNEDQA